jgi:hypothetical protein
MFGSSMLQQILQIRRTVCQFGGIRKHYEQRFWHDHNHEFFLRSVAAGAYSKFETGGNF